MTIEQDGPYRQVCWLYKLLWKWCNSHSLVWRNYWLHDASSSWKNSVPPDLRHIVEALLKFGKDVFPTVCIAYRLPLTIEFSVAKLKLIKTYLRSSMSNERLTNLSLLSIEKQFLSSDVKNEVIKIFYDIWFLLGHRK